ncbi:hypothetical protein [Sphingobium yanoikuyae]|uniref:hypothetical protein n=1 Tax=Sphingobium yanoikuyae TaxID=13690 RepID=UPI0028AC79F0|nr:hypothetical protein [Sphingobium yanoikuyae]
MEQIKLRGIVKWRMKSSSDGKKLCRNYWKSADGVFKPAPSTLCLQDLSAPGFTAAAQVLLQICVGRRDPKYRIMAFEFRLWRSRQSSQSTWHGRDCWRFGVSIRDYVYKLCRAHDFAVISGCLGNDLAIHENDAWRHIVINT